MPVGSDKVHLWVLRALTEQEAEPLGILFEKSQQSSVVSMDWKRGNITQILSKGY